MQNLNILESRCKPAEQVRTHWHARASQGATPETLTEPSLWANVARHMHRYDRIEVVASDESWWAEYLIWDIDPENPTWAKVELVQVRHRPGSQEAEGPVADGYDLKQRGVRKWSVIRKSDGQVMQDLFATRAEAAAYLETLVARMAA